MTRLYWAVDEFFLRHPGHRSLRWLHDRLWRLCYSCRAYDEAAKEIER